MHLLPVFRVKQRITIILIYSGKTISIHGTNRLPFHGQRPGQHLIHHDSLAQIIPIRQRDLVHVTPEIKPETPIPIPVIHQTQVHKSLETLVYHFSCVIIQHVLPRGSRHLFRHDQIGSILPVNIKSSLYPSVKQSEIDSRIPRFCLLPTQIGIRQF